uniref:receptor protein-tyrosine kinase n=1 Tax=Astatotilapia calliptera TaxID=8154 RepID=A0AAX7VMJ8_ASTCA
AAFLSLLVWIFIQPLISPGGPHIVVPKKGKLELRCYDNATTSGAPPRLRWYRDKSRKLDGEVQEGNVAFVRLSAAQLNHMGRYICVNNITLEQSSIYVYVKDPYNAFLHIMINIKLVREGDSCTIPCLVTDPEVTHLGLETCDGRPLPSGMSYKSDLQEGITINNIQKEYDGCYVCVGLLHGVKVMSSKYNLEVRLGNMLLCLLFATLQHPFETQTSHILSGGLGYERSTSLLIPAVNQSDSGTYRCHAHNERGRSDEAMELKVYDQGFIKMLVSQSPVQEEVKEGESLSLKVEFDAYPAPSFMSWSYNGKILHNTTEHVITLHRNKYRYSSKLRLVRVLGSEGGIYNFSASHKDASVDHSFHVYVNSKPVITAQEGPVDGQVRCIAAGYPVPKISWYFCELPRTRCSQLPNATQWETSEVTVLSESTFGRSQVESRLNVSKEFTQYHTLECVASTEEAEAYTLFSIKRVVPHKLFTPLLTGMVATGVLLSLVLVVLLYKYLQKPKFQIQWKVIETVHGNNHIYIDPTQLPYDSKWEFPRQKLRFGKTLGSGAFGKVVRATAYGLCSADAVTTVAVKMLKPNAHSTEKEALMSELKVLIYLGNHVNIVNLLGACTVGGPILVITEYCCYGDLLNFLRRKRESFLNSRAGDGYMPMRPSEKERSSESDDIDELSLDAEDLLSFSYQVAKGMEYITSRNCIHRDLAARNILLTHGRVAKICDFGLARDITTDASYVLRGNARLPVKWMSPESIFDCVYTIESDVWSYGILLWEIFSLGNSPYPGMQVGSAFYRMIQEGHRMSRPEYAPTEMYDMMLSCWNHDPLKRPSFKKLVEKTELLLSENTKNVSARTTLSLTFVICLFCFSLISLHFISKAQKLCCFFFFLSFFRKTQVCVTPQVYLTLSNASGPPEQQRAPSRRLSSVCSTTAPNQPLLQNTADVFLDYV